VARAGGQGIIRSLRFGGGQGNLKDIPNGLAPMPTGVGLLTGMVIVDP